MKFCIKNFDEESLFSSEYMDIYRFINLSFINLFFFRVIIYYKYSYKYEETKEKNAISYSIDVNLC